MIDTVGIYHDLISSDSECSRELISVFGKGISLSPGIDRTKLREIVFTSKNKLKILNDITHKHILSQVRRFICEIEQTSDNKAIIFDAPLLFESGFDKECDVTVCVIADEETRIKRITERDAITKEVAISRIRSQISNEELLRICDFTIVNDSTIDSLREKVLNIKRQIIDN